jgi:hypothetical protein
MALAVLNAAREEDRPGEEPAGEQSEPSEQSEQRLGPDFGPSPVSAPLAATTGDERTPAVPLASPREPAGDEELSEARDQALDPDLDGDEGWKEWDAPDDAAAPGDGRPADRELPLDLNEWDDEADGGLAVAGSGDDEWIEEEV